MVQDAQPLGSGGGFGHAAHQKRGQPPSSPSRQPRRQPLPAVLSSPRPKRTDAASSPGAIELFKHVAMQHLEAPDTGDKRPL
ncbi:uncharacterized protein IUM83_07830 [Phytophthora cinnamomi]|uniref:uncharacterized protein n=1 Tax=Phytophthora cinnamomi TaxID=4785 RepID=UPI003559AF7A|nr:hypothetical protein IUM83_07830 [Phytophthora cinnamomi]